MKLYSGVRTNDGCEVRVHEPGGHTRGLDLRLDVRSHSSTGAEWGYSGSGPAQLALALACDVLGDDEAAQAVYQDLKFRVVGRLPHDNWVLSEEQLRESIRQLQAERQRSDRGR